MRAAVLAALAVVVLLAGCQHEQQRVLQEAERESLYRPPPTIAKSLW